MAQDEVSKKLNVCSILLVETAKPYLSTLILWLFIFPLVGESQASGGYFWLVFMFRLA